MLQQTFAEHMVGLTLWKQISAQDFIHICSLTRLKYLCLRVQGIDFQSNILAAKGMASLESLRHLRLKGIEAVTLANLDLSALTDLTSMDLENMGAMLAAASTVPNLQYLRIAAAPDRPSAGAISAMLSLTCIRQCVKLMIASPVRLSEPVFLFSEALGEHKSQSAFPLWPVAFAAVGSFMLP